MQGRQEQPASCPPLRKVLDKKGLVLLWARKEIQEEGPWERQEVPLLRASELLQGGGAKDSTEEDGRGIPGIGHEGLRDKAPSCSCPGC